MSTAQELFLLNSIIEKIVCWNRTKITPIFSKYFMIYCRKIAQFQPTRETPKHSYIPFDLFKLRLNVAAQEYGLKIELFSLVVPPSQVLA